MVGLEWCLYKKTENFHVGFLSGFFHRVSLVNDGVSYCFVFRCVHVLKRTVVDLFLKKVAAKSCFFTFEPSFAAQYTVCRAASCIEMLKMIGSFC